MEPCCAQFPLTYKLEFYLVHGTYGQLNQPKVWVWQGIRDAFIGEYRCKLLVEESMPEIVHSDQGQNFESVILKQL